MRTRAHRRTTCTRASPTQASICSGSKRLDAEEGDVGEEMVEPAAVAADDQDPLDGPGRWAATSASSRSVASFSAGCRSMHRAAPLGRITSAATAESKSPTATVDVEPKREGVLQTAVRSEHRGRRAGRHARTRDREDPHPRTTTMTSSDTPSSAGITQIRFCGSAARLTALSARLPELPVRSAHLSAWRRTVPIVTRAMRRGKLDQGQVFHVPPTSCSHARGQVVARASSRPRIPAIVSPFRLPDSLLAVDAAVDGGEPAAEVRGDLTHAVAVYARWALAISAASAGAHE